MKIINVNFKERCGRREPHPGVKCQIIDFPQPPKKIPLEEVTGQYVRNLLRWKGLTGQFPDGYQIMSFRMGEHFVSVFLRDLQRDGANRRVWTELFFDPESITQTFFCWATVDFMLRKARLRFESEPEICKYFMAFDESTA